MAKARAAHVLFEHAKNRAALFVGEKVEHALCFFGFDYLELDGTG